MVLAIVVAAAAMKTAATTAEVRTRATAPMALVTISLAAINIDLFVARHLIAYAIACIVDIAKRTMARAARAMATWLGNPLKILQNSAIIPIPDRLNSGTFIGISFF